MNPPSLSRNMWLDPKFILGLLISAVAVYFAFRNFDFVEFRSALKQASYGYIVLATSVLLIATWIRAIRWQSMLRPAKEIKVYPLFRQEMIGYFGNSVLPLRMGELLRAYLTSREQKVSGSVVLGSVILERLLDTAGLMVFALILILVYPLPTDIRTKLHLGLFGLICIGLAMLFFLWRLGRSQGQGRILKLLRTFFTSFSVLNGKDRWSTLVITMLLWVMYLSSSFLIQKGMHLGLSIEQTLLVLVISSLAFAVPSAPGTIGTYHWAVTFSLVNLIGGYTNEVAINFAIVLHAYSYIMFIVMGSYFFFTSQFHSGAIGKLINEPESENPGVPGSLKSNS